ncbi:hypothetical protein [Microbispora hainanensis]|uniref:DUF2179 domain-containing protein n=1 Tax=Microbispora hainanensis TaxID=568844 RepID=A0ABZ1SMA7_9ACTN|nr:hypothetical protein [Microbispora hainanensis]
MNLGKALRAIWVSLSGSKEPVGRRQIAYYRSVVPTAVTVGLLGVVEVVGVDFVVSGTVARLPAFVAGVVANVVLLGFVVALTAFPHYLDTEKKVLMLCYGATFELAIPVALIREIRQQRRSHFQRKTAEARDGILRVPVAGETNLVIVLKNPAGVALPKAEHTPVREINVYALDPRRAVDLVSDVIDSGRCEK